MSLADWDDRLTRALVKPPFTDAEGRKGWLARFTKAPPHRIRRFALAIPGWPLFARPMRVAFLADFHVGSHAGDVERLEQIVAEASSYTPDVVMLGGDFVNMIPFGGGRVPPDVIARILGKLDAPLGRIAVLGNHDRNYGADEVTAALRAQGITVLGRDPHPLAYEDAAFDVVGVHDARVYNPKTPQRLAALQAERPSIVLTHDPFWLNHVPAGPHVVLAGHTHGGQICLPWFGALRNASRAPMRWTYGWVEEQGRLMYVTSGLGCSGIPLRLNMPPEYALIEINGA